MKYFAVMLSIVLCNCNPYHPLTQSEADKAVVIQVECNNLKDVEMQVILALKSVMVSDLERESNGSFLIIKARYKELPDFKAK